MRKYNFKKDFNRITSVIFSFVIILVIFIVFALLILLPIYLLSKNNPKIYSISISLLILSILLFFSVRWGFKIWSRYKNIYYLVHLIFSPFLILIIFTLLGFEFTIFRIIELFNPNNNELISPDNISYVEKSIYIITACLNLFNIPFLLTIIFIILNAVFIKLLFEILPFIPAFIVMIIINLILLVLLFLLRRLFYFVNSKLKEHEIKKNQ